jgi:hypothetical protein
VGMDADKEVANPFEYFAYNFGYDVVEESKKAMKEFDGEWEFPKDYF